MQVLASLGPVTVGPILSSISVECVDDKWIVHYKWLETSESLPGSAWIGLYASGQPDESYLAFNYLNKDSSNVIFNQRFQNGVYEFRFFAYKYDGFGLADLKNATVSVKQEDFVSLIRQDDKCIVNVTLASIDPLKQTNCWVGIFHKNDSRPTSYRRSSYISTPKQVFTFKTMIHSGNYEARIYDGESRLLAKSTDINIVGL